MATTTIYPFAVNNIELEAPTTISNSKTVFFATGHFGTPQTWRALLDFRPTVIGRDFTGISGNLLITVSANFLGAAHTLNVYLVKRLWRKGQGPEASWNNYRQDQAAAWTTAGAGDTTNDRAATPIGSVALTSATTGQVSIALDPTQLTNWLTGAGGPYYGLLLQASDESGTTLVRWATLDAAIGSRPQIALTYTPSVHALTDNAIAYWTLNDLSGADATGNGHTLTMVASPTNATGELGQALAVNGTTQYASNNDAALKVGASDFTVCGWAYVTDTVTFRIMGGSGHEATVPHGGWILIYHGSATAIPNLVAQLGDNAGNVVSDVIDAAYIQTDGGPKVSLPVNTWVFWAVRHDATRKYFELFTDYRDGNGMRGPSSAASHDDGGNFGPYPGYLSPTQVPANPTGITAWGADPDLSGFFQGRLDEIYTAGRWLSDTEITAVRDAVLAGNSYPFTPPVLPTGVAGIIGNDGSGIRRNHIGGGLTG